MLSIYDITDGSNYTRYYYGVGSAYTRSDSSSFQYVSGGTVTVYSDHITFMGDNYYYDASSHSWYIIYIDLPDGYYSNPNNAGDGFITHTLSSDYYPPPQLGRVHESVVGHDYGQAIDDMIADYTGVDPIVTDVVTDIVGGDVYVDVQVDVNVTNDVHVDITLPTISIDPDSPVTWYTTPAPGYESPQNIQGGIAGAFGLSYYIMQRLHLIAFITIGAFIGVVAIFFRGKGG